MARNEQSSKKRNEMNQKDRQSSGALQRRDDENRSALTGSPFGFMRRFSEEMDRLFQDFGFGHGTIAPGFERSLDELGAIGRGAWAPEVEVVERNNQLVIRTDLPGMQKDDIDVDIDEKSVVIQGERKSEHQDDEDGYYRTERSYGSFYRRIPLPKGINVDEARADFSNGVLEITMPVPKEVPEKSRKLEIGKESESQPRAKAKGAGR